MLTGHPVNAWGGWDFIDAKRACDAGEIGEPFMAEGALRPRSEAGVQTDAMAGQRCRKTLSWAVPAIQ